MDDLIGKAHAYLDDKGCRSIGQKYTAFEIERMLADFAQQQLNLLNIPVVSNNEVVVCPECKGSGKVRSILYDHICDRCGGEGQTDC